MDRMDPTRRRFTPTAPSSVFPANALFPIELKLNVSELHIQAWLWPFQGTRLLKMMMFILAFNSTIILPLIFADHDRSEVRMGMATNLTDMTSHLGWYPCWTHSEKSVTAFISIQDSMSYSEFWGRIHINTILPLDVNFCYDKPPSTWPTKWIQRRSKDSSSSPWPQQEKAFYCAILDANSLDFVYLADSRLFRSTLWHFPFDQGDTEYISLHHGRRVAFSLLNPRLGTVATWLGLSSFRPAKSLSLWLFFLELHLHILCLDCTYHERNSDREPSNRLVAVIAFGSLGFWANGHRRSLVGSTCQGTISDILSQEGSPASSWCICYRGRCGRGWWQARQRMETGVE